MAAADCTVRCCCIAAATFLALSLSFSSQAAAEALVRSGDGGSGIADMLDVAASAAFEITQSDDRGAMRKLLASSDRETPELAVVLAECRMQRSRCKELAQYMQHCVQIHGRGCLRCTYSTISHVSAAASECTAVRGKRWVLQGRHTVPAAGYQLDSAGDSVACKAGYAKARPGASACKRCGAAKYSPRPHSTRCLSCPRPKIVNVAHTSCIPPYIYPPGQQPGRNGKPRPCPSGTAKRGPGAFACQRCNGVVHGQQRYQSSNGATSCELCAAGGRVNAARTSCSLPSGAQLPPGMMILRPPLSQLASPPSTPPPHPPPRPSPAAPPNPPPQPPPSPPPAPPPSPPLQPPPPAKAAIAVQVTKEAAGGVLLFDPVRYLITVTVDTNKDGLVDAGEPGLANVTVQCTATNAFGVITDSTLTTTLASGQAVTDFPGGGGTSGTPDIVTVLCTATPADQVLRASLILQQPVALDATASFVGQTYNDVDANTTQGPDGPIYPSAQVVCDLYDPAQQKATTFTRTSDASGNLSIQVPGAVNSVPGDFTLKCTTMPRDEDLESYLPGQSEHVYTVIDPNPSPPLQPPPGIGCPTALGC